MYDEKPFGSIQFLRRLASCLHRDGRLVADEPVARAARRIVLVGLLTVTAAPSQADVVTCGDPFVNSFGPFDYRNATIENRSVVERVHFTSDTERLIPGSGTGYPLSDIDYTLRVFPNHPRGLLAMSKLSLREKDSRSRRATLSIECYFDRAIRFANDDPSVFLVYGMHLMNSGNTKSAVTQLKKAETLSKDLPDVQYNLGLAYFELKDYDAALLHAQRAYALGFPLPGLRNMLVRANKWTESAGEGASTSPSIPKIWPGAKATQKQ